MPSPFPLLFPFPSSRHLRLYRYVDCTTQHIDRSIGPYICLSSMTGSVVSLEVSRTTTRSKYFDMRSPSVGSSRSRSRRRVDGPRSPTRKIVDSVLEVRVLANNDDDDDGDDDEAKEDEDGDDVDDDIDDEVDDDDNGYSATLHQKRYGTRTPMTDK
ncbi:hypothetical protein GE21DRAFT_1321097 [Neurospora crassa]|nr:hypothetical protein GE21DRAFT_1321097 [Neurospora crassa]